MLRLIAVYLATEELTAIHVQLTVKTDQLTVLTFQFPSVQLSVLFFN